MSLITSICNDYKKYILSDISDEEDVQDRVQACRILAQKTVNALASAMGFSEKKRIAIRLKKNAFDIIPSANGTYYEVGHISFPILLFYDKEEIPFDGPNDPQLNNVKKVQDFYNSLQETFQISKKNVSIEDLHNLRLYLRFLQNPQEAKKALKFALAHELGHIFYAHHKIQNKSVLQSFYNILCLGLPSLIKHIRIEQEADKFSYAHSLEMAEGGIYLFQTLIENCQGPMDIKVVNTLMRLFLTFSHSSCTSRIAKIKKHWPELDLRVISIKEQQPSSP